MVKTLVNKNVIKAKSWGYFRRFALGSFFALCLSNFGTIAGEKPNNTDAKKLFNNFFKLFSINPQKGKNLIFKKPQKPSLKNIMSESDSPKFTPEVLREAPDDDRASPDLPSGSLTPDLLELPVCMPAMAADQDPARMLLLHARMDGPRKCASLFLDDVAKCKDDASPPSSSSSFSTPGIGLVQLNVTEGPPGLTPFPHRKSCAKITPDESQVGDSGILACSSPIATAPAASPADSPDSPPPVAVPFNSPDDGMLEEILKAEAKKQERKIKEKLEDEKLVALFKTPERRVPVPRPRKRLRDVLSREQVTSRPSLSPLDLQILPRDSRVSRTLPETVADKETSRRTRINDTVELLREAVPGCDLVADKAEVYEITAKYILYMKSKVGNAHDREFLKEFMPY